ncbi:MAG: anion permease [Agathobacter sp.]|nr:anion permease [Agathobacter sp.]
MKQVVIFIKNETVLFVAWTLAFISAVFVKPSGAYFDYIDFRSLGILWSLMVIMQGLKQNGVFSFVGMRLLAKTKRVWQLAAVLIFLCFFCSMFITNDVALITFVPFAVMMLQACKKEGLMIPVIVLQTVAANLGSMLTPIGNPQNLYLFGISQMSVVEFICWMLPYTIFSGILLMGCICFLKGKSDPVVPAISERNLLTNENGRVRKACVYMGLFVLSLLVVGRVLAYGYMVVIVFVIVFIMEKETIFHVDYSLLLTFVGFFIFTGNMGKIPAVSSLLQQMIQGREVFLGVLISQCISNVPATLLLAGFTEEYKNLLLGVNIGGLGTLIASMASLISYKIFANTCSKEKGRYFMHFTVVNVLFLIALLLLYAVCKTEN